jgi:hypothetical protein
MLKDHFQIKFFLAKRNLFASEQSKTFASEVKCARQVCENFSWFSFYRCQRFDKRINQRMLSSTPPPNLETNANI